MAKKASVSYSTVRPRSRSFTTPRSSPIPGGVPPRLTRQAVRQARNRFRTVGRDGGRSPEVITVDDITEEEQFDGQVAELGATEERRLNSSQDSPPLVLNLPSSPRPPRLSISTSTQTARTPPVFRCPVCLQGLEDLVDRQVDIVSTVCGHVFCRSCLDITLSSTR